MKTNAYSTFRDSLRDEENNFIQENIFFAFNAEQFGEGLKKIGVETIKDVVSSRIKLYLFFLNNFTYCLKITAEEAEEIINNN